MKVMLQGDKGTLALPNEPDQLITRIDRYTKAGSLFKRPEEVEIWRLEDGRQIRLCRINHKDEWNIRWREVTKF